MDRGGVGRPMAGERGPFSVYDELRLKVGVLAFEDAGDCCEGGVYGISANRVLVWLRAGRKLA